MATVVDDLVTRLSLTGSEKYQKGLGTASGAIDHLAMRADRFGRYSTVGFGLATAGALGYLKAAKAAGEEAEQFGRASGNFSQSGGFPVADLTAYASGLEKTSRFSDGVIADTLGIAGAMGLTATAAKQLTSASANAAEALRSKGVTLPGAAEAGGKAVQTGQTRGLREMGVFLDANAFRAASLEERLQMVVAAYNKIGGPDAALRGTKTLSGSIDQLNNSVGNLQEAFGKIGVEPLTKLVNSTTKVIDVFNEAPDAVKHTVSVVGVGLVGAAVVGAIKMKMLEYQAYKNIAAFGQTTLATRAMNAELRNIPAAGGGFPVGHATPGQTVNTAAGKGKGGFGKGGAIKTALAIGATDMAFRTISANAAGEPTSTARAVDAGTGAPAVDPKVGKGLVPGGGAKGAVDAGSKAVGFLGKAKGMAGGLAGGMFGRIGIGLAMETAGQAIVDAAYARARSTEVNGRDPLTQLGLSTGRTLQTAGVGYSLGGVGGAVAGAPVGAAGAIYEGGTMDKLLTDEWKAKVAEIKANDPNAAMLDELKKMNAKMDRMTTKAIDYNGLSVVQQRVVLNAARSIA